MTVRIGVVGSGFMAGTHLGAYANVKDAEVVAICARNEEKGRSLADEHGASWLSTLEQLLEADAVDAVDLCVPTDLHVEMAEAALSAGKHVLLEKPIALDIDGADRLVSLADESDGVLMVAMILRFWPEYAHFLAMQSAEVGAVETFTGYRLSPPAAWNDWMIDDSRSGGVAVDLMIHDIDMAIAVNGPVEGVSALSTSDGQHIFARLDHRSGAVTALEASMRMPAAFPFSCGFRAVGRDASVQYDFQVGVTVEGGNLGEAATPNGLLVVPTDGDASRVEVPQADPFTSEVSYFVECAQAGVAPERATARQARDALACALAINQSLQTGDSVDL